MNKNIYVAGASKEMEMVTRVIYALREKGYTVTYDWPEEIRKAGAANEGLDDATKERCADECLSGVDASDVFWMLTPETSSAGAWVELGYALSVSKNIIVSGRNNSIFAALVHRRFDTHGEALAWLLKQ